MTHIHSVRAAAIAMFVAVISIGALVPAMAHAEEFGYSDYECYSCGAWENYESFENGTSIEDGSVVYGNGRIVDYTWFGVESFPVEGSLDYAPDYSGGERYVFMDDYNPFDAFGYFE